MSKTKIDQSDFSEMSSKIAEDEHHKDCKFECCGEHYDGFIEDNTTCKVCGMTGDQQQDHNDDVWSIIDEAEGSLLERYVIIT